MKQLLIIALIWMMSANVIKEIEMPPIREDRQDRLIRPPRPPRPLRRPPRPTPNPPAWLGNLNGGVGQNQNQNGWLQDRLDNLNDLGTPTGLGGGNAPVPNFNTPSNVLTPNGGAFSPPAWIQSQLNRPPAYGGSYPASTNQDFFSGGWQWLQDRLKKLNDLGTPTGLGGGNAPVPNFNTQYDEPMTLEPALPALPEVPTYDVSQTHPYGGVPAYMQAPVTAPSTSTPSFGSNYGGNWRKRGGGGGGGGDWGGGGGYDTRDWMNTLMNLYSWKF